MNEKHAHTSADEARREAAKALQTALDRRDSATPPESRATSR
jgi:hypothetical protein